MDDLDREPEEEEGGGAGIKKNSRKASHFASISSVHSPPPLPSSPSLLKFQHSKQRNRFEFFEDPSTMADDELVDPKKYLEDNSKGKCVKALYDYQACVKRIQDDESGHKHCTGQYFDYWSCIDKSVAEKLFSQLK